MNEGGDGQATLSMVSVLPLRSLNVEFIKTILRRFGLDAFLTDGGGGRRLSRVVLRLRGILLPAATSLDVLGTGESVLDEVCTNCTTGLLDGLEEVAAVILKDVECAEPSMCSLVPTGSCAAVLISLRGAILTKGLDCRKLGNLKEMGIGEFFVLIVVTSEVATIVREFLDCKLCRLGAQGINIDLIETLEVNQQHASHSQNCRTRAKNAHVLLNSEIKRVSLPDRPGDCRDETAPLTQHRTTVLLRALSYSVTIFSAFSHGVALGGPYRGGLSYRAGARFFGVWLSLSKFKVVLCVLLTSGVRDLTLKSLSLPIPTRKSAFKRQLRAIFIAHEDNLEEV